MNGKSIVENIRLPREEKLGGTREVTLELTVNELEQLRGMLRGFRHCCASSRSFARILVSENGYVDVARVNMNHLNLAYSRFEPLMQKILGEQGPPKGNQSGG